jgi:hypothetical protein
LAFKDTSGTAVIDAVLTDIGRKRMADGTFRPVKFALGDDEVDFGWSGCFLDRRLPNLAIRNSNV